MTGRRLDPLRPAVGIAFTVALLLAGEYVLALIGALVSIPLSFLAYRSWRRHEAPLKTES